MAAWRSLLRPGLPLLETAARRGPAGRSALATFTAVRPPPSTGPCEGPLCSGRRTFYASKWQKRLGHLLESRRRPAVPDIPETEVITKGSKIRNVKPILGSKRTAVMAYKVGCMSLWDEWGEKHMITVCQVDRLHVLRQMTIQRDGYEALQLGMGYRSAHRQKRPTLGLFIKAGVGPKHHICEFRVSSDCMLPVGHQITVRHFVAGQWCFVSGMTKAKGYQGVMKRWGFAGGGSDKRGHRQSHRAAGSMGQRGAAKVWKGKKAHGHMGPDPRCVNAQVFRIESARNLIFLKGPLPGFKGSIVKISDARGKTALKNRHIRLPHPTFVPDPEVEYPVTIQKPPPERDPFLYPEQPLYQPND
mmetsp:Transcript_70333/g.228619  ORF Transcript_70333/g.228619 Transcript_70333/m.228619 type:complete len:359 (+) Transcript_70333:126-1202(+)